MKGIWRGVLVATLCGVGFNLMPFTVRSETPAKEHSALEQRNEQFSGSGSESMSEPAGAESLQAANNSNERKMIATADGPIALGTGPVRIALETVATAGERTLASRITALAPGRYIYLVIKNLRVVNQPGILYRLYLDLPPDTKPVRNDPHYVGTLNFFNAVESGGFGAPSGNDSRFFSYDVTATVRSLQARGLLCDNTTLTIFPSGTPAAGAEPSIGRIELVEQ